MWRSTRRLQRPLMWPSHQTSLSLLLVPPCRVHSAQGLVLRVTALPTTLCLARRFVGPRQYSPKGYRDAAGRLPMTFAFGEECNVLAKAAHTTRNYGDAITLYDRCLTMRREKYGPIHDECAATLHNIGRVFIDMQEYSSAENALTEAAAIYEELHGTKSLRYAESLALLALCYTHLKFFDEAEKAFKESIRTFRELCYNYNKHSWLPDSSSESTSNGKALDNPQNHPLSSVAHALADCATLFLARRQEREAIAFLEEALEIRRYLYSKHQKYMPMIAQTLNKLCELRKSIDDAVGAELAINECLKICISCFGRDHPATAQAKSSKASLLAAKKQFREAKRLYEDSTATYAISLGKDSPIYGQELVKLGRIHDLLDDLTNAEKIYRKGLTIIKGGFGEQSVQVAEVNAFLGSLLVKKLAMKEATELFHAAIRIRKAIDPADPQLAFLYQKLGDAYATQRETHAEAYFLLAIEAFKANAKVEPIQRTFMTDVLDDLGLFYMDFSHYDKAEQCFKEALDVRIELLGQYHATVAYSYSNFALLHLLRQEYELCEKMSLASLDMYGKTAKSNVLAQADVYNTLGQCYHQQGKLPEAVKWHEKALNIRRTRGETSATAVVESLNNLARVYISLKEYAKASKLVQEAQRVVAPLHVDLTQSLRNEVAKTVQLIPPMEQWPETQRSEAQVKLAV